MLTLVAATAFEWILPVGWSLAHSTETAYSPWFLIVATVVVTVLLLCVLFEPLRFRWRHVANMFWYPPTWVPLLLGLTFAAIVECCVPPDIRPQTITPGWLKPDVVLPFGIAILGVIMFRVLARTHPRGQRSPPASAPSGQRPLAAGTGSTNEIQRWLSSGERPILCADDDLFDRLPMSVRIAARLAAGRSVALVGPQGGGKTSILNLVRAQLRESEITTIVADLDVWSVPSARDVPRVALTQIVNALNEHVDTIFPAWTCPRPTNVWRRRLPSPTSGRLSVSIGKEVPSRLSNGLPLSSTS